MERIIKKIFICLMAFLLIVNGMIINVYGQSIIKPQKKDNPYEMMVDTTPDLMTVNEIIKSVCPSNVTQTAIMTIDGNIQPSDYDDFDGVKQLIEDKIDIISQNKNDLVIDPILLGNILKRQHDLVEESKTDRFIVKYKGEGEESFKGKIEGKIQKSIKIENLVPKDFNSMFESNSKKKPIQSLGEFLEDTTDNIDFLNEKKGKTELIILEESMNPSEFAEVLKEHDVDEEIEYIQPDFEMSLAGIEDEPIDDTLEEKPTDGAIKEVTAEEPASEEIPSDEAIAEEFPVEEPSTTKKIIVAVIDTGLDITHSDLKDYIYTNSDEIPNNGIDDDGNGYVDDVNGWSFPDNLEIVYEESLGLEQSHATHIAGIIAGLSNADDNLTPNNNISILPLKVFSNGTAYTSDIIAAIEYAEKMGAEIVNCSFGSTNNNRALKEAIENSEMLFISSAGNARTDLETKPIYPACFDLDNIISVTSTNADGGISYFSNYNSRLVDVTALGRDISSTLPNDEYGIQSGTSMSTAMVSGVAAAVLSTDDTLNPAGLKERILSTSDMLSNLQEVVDNGRLINTLNAINNLEQTDIIQNLPESDFDVRGYCPTQDELYQLYNSGNVIQGSAGYCFSLVLKNDGTVWSWGANGHGECGNGSIADSVALTQVVGLTNVISIAAGTSHSLAVKSDGTVWAWGSNNYGQLGDSTWQTRATPVQVSGLNDIVSIAAGYSHSLAVKSDGTVWAWGYNNYGQLGDQTRINRKTPVQVYGELSPLTDVISVAAGYAHSLALKSDGTVWSWGSNNSYQLGDWTGTYRTMPEQISNIGGVINIAAGAYHSLAIDIYGNIYAWGENSFGQIGDWSTSNRRMPYIVLSNAESVDAGDYYSLAVGLDGTVWEWGSNEYGQLGDVTSELTIMPVQVSGLTDVIGIAAGYLHSLAVKSDGTVWAWGSDDYGQLGNGITTRLTPVQISNLTDIESTAAGAYHSLAVKSDGTVWAWGSNDYGQLGDSTTVAKSTPVQIIGLSDVIGIAAGAYYSLALKSDGTVWAWGSNDYGQLGDGTMVTRTTPVQVSGLMDAVSIAAGSYHSLAIDSYGYIHAWGSNNYGQLGDQTITNRTTPVQVCGESDPLMDVISIAAGYAHSLAVKSDGTVWSWGSNDYDQLGDSSTSYRAMPKHIDEISDIVKIAAGTYHSLALDSYGSIFAWGDNRSGQIGDWWYTGETRCQPYQVLSGAVNVDAGDYYSLTVGSDGSVWSWGANNYGQLGIGIREIIPMPMQVNNLDDIISISAGLYHSLAVKTDNTVMAWGNDSYGQLGQSRRLQSSTVIQCQAYVSTLSFVSTNYTAVIPIIGSNLITVSAIGSDFYGNMISASAITYSFANAYDGVSINSTTGEITITPLAQPGSVQVVATYQNQTCNSTLLLTVETVSDVTISCTLGQDIYIPFYIYETNNLNGIVFALNYNAEDLDVVDLICQTKALETTAGIVTGTGIEILSCTPGIITFTINKDIPEEKVWSGVINIFKFRAKITGQTTVSAEYN